MFGVVKYVLDMFHFSEFQYYIAVFCLVVFLGNFLAGLLYGIALAFGGPLKPRQLSDRIAFRFCVFSDLLLVVFAIYYHTALIGEIEPSHFVFWLFAVFATPILAFISSQITGLIFRKRIAANRREYRRRVEAGRMRKGARRRARY
jgi:hypothetical protein